jgi:hypothetical protein
MFAESLSVGAVSESWLDKIITMTLWNTAAVCTNALCYACQFFFFSLFLSHSPSLSLSGRPWRITDTHVWAATLGRKGFDTHSLSPWYVARSRKVHARVKRRKVRTARRCTRAHAFLPRHLPEGAQNRPRAARDEVM